MHTLPSRGKRGIRAFCHALAERSYGVVIPAASWTCSPVINAQSSDLHAPGTTREGHRARRRRDRVVIVCGMAAAADLGTAASYLGPVHELGCSQNIGYD